MGWRYAPPMAKPRSAVQSSTSRICIDCWVGSRISGSRSGASRASTRLLVTNGDSAFTQDRGHGSGTNPRSTRSSDRSLNSFLPPPAFGGGANRSLTRRHGAGSPARRHGAGSPAPAAAIEARLTLNGTASRSDPPRGYALTLFSAHWPVSRVSEIRCGVRSADAVAAGLPSQTRD